MGGYGRSRGAHAAPFYGAPASAVSADRRTPGEVLYGFTPPDPYAVPRYPAPPPRRPFMTMPGWREAPELRGPRGRQLAPLGAVIQSIQRRAPGRQLDAEVGYLGGRSVYRVLWLTARGRRMDYVVDAETGAILSER
jgi:hypothetical protein